MTLSVFPSLLRYFALLAPRAKPRFRLDRLNRVVGIEVVVSALNPYIPRHFSL